MFPVSASWAPGFCDPLLLIGSFLCRNSEGSELLLIFVHRSAQNLAKAQLGVTQTIQGSNPFNHIVSYPNSIVQRGDRTIEKQGFGFAFSNNLNRWEFSRLGALKWNKPQPSWETQWQIQQESQWFSKEVDTHLIESNQFNCLAASRFHHRDMKRRPLMAA